MSVKNLSGAFLVSIGFLAVPLSTGRADRLAMMPNADEIYKEGDKALNPEGLKVPEGMEKRLVDFFTGRFGKPIEEKTSVQHPQFHRTLDKMTAVEIHNLINDKAIGDLYRLDVVVIAPYFYRGMPNLIGVADDYYHNNNALFFSEVSGSSLLTPMERGDLLRRLINKFRLPSDVVKNYNTTDLTQMMMQGPD